ncbi:MAG: alanine racemase [Treponema sp.]|jgi:alanine racemase|nr:alanine racemase [Treponema sp.]
MRATRAIVHLDRLIQNIRAVRQKVGERRLICMPVKADAYGHGAVQAAGAAQKAGVHYLAVATVDEGILLREQGIDFPILLLSIPQPEELPDVAANSLSPFISDREFAVEMAGAAARVKRRLFVHLKVDTGMGRVGVSPENAAELAGFIASQPSLFYAGTATHLAVADSRAQENVEFTKTQLALFQKALSSIRQAGLDPGIVHAANSGGVILHEDSWFDMVRPGIALYGYSPLGPGDATLPLKPVMELKSRISFIKRIKKGETVSYGRRWTAPEDTWIGTLPLGYADGLPRALENFSVRIRDSFYPLAGRVCMDQCMVNLGGETDIERWEDVTIFGGSAAGAWDIAEKVGTIPYEVTCNISRRVPRIYES